MYIFLLFFILFNLGLKTREEKRLIGVVFVSVYLMGIFLLKITNIKTILKASLNRIK